MSLPLVQKQSPQKKKSQMLSDKWLDLYSWLPWDDKLCGMTCLACYHTGQSNPFTTGCINFRSYTKNTFSSRLNCWLLCNADRSVMAVPDGSASSIQSEKDDAQCLEEMQITDLVKKRKGTIPAGAPVIKKSKTVCPVEPSDEETNSNPQDQRNNEQETGRVVEQGKIAYTQGKLGKVLQTKERGSLVSSVPAEENWNSWPTKEPIPPSPVSKATPYQLGETLKETTACGVHTDVASINVSPDHLDHIYHERGKHCEMVVTLSLKVEPEEQSATLPKLDQLLHEPKGVNKKLHDMIISKQMGKGKPNQQYKN